MKELRRRAVRRGFEGTGGEQQCQRLPNRCVVVNDRNCCQVSSHRLTISACGVSVELALGSTPGPDGIQRFPPAGCTPAFCATLTKSATDWTPSFLMARPRWTLTVFITVPSSWAICLLSL